MTYTYNYNFDSSDAVLGGLLVGYLITFLVIYVLSVIAMWKIFTKAGQAGWKCLIPIYNLVILFRIAGISPWWILAYLATFIPVVGWVVSLALSIYLMVNLAKAFGKEGGFAVGLILLNTIFMMILAFGDAEYQLDSNEV